jgi:cytidylate kinase
MLIGISGKMGSGKDTLGDMLTAVEPQYKIKKYATKLKQIASLLSGISVEKFESQDFKKFDMPTVWNKINKPTSAYGEQVTKMTVREFLQKIGTDALRDGLHDDVWINALYSNYSVKIDQDFLNMSVKEAKKLGLLKENA